MRKTLTQALCAAFCAILACATLEGGGVMLIGMRNAMLAKGGWKNPYVTDGLVAMWDGEWNAGPGVHDANLMALNDLSGYGRNVSIKSSYGELGTNSLVCKKRSSGGYPTIPIGPIPGVVSFDIVLKPAEKQIQYALVLGYDGTYERQLLLDGNGRLWFARYTNTTNFDVYVKDETLSCAAVYENHTSCNVASIYKNGEPINMVYGNDYWPATNNVVLGGGRTNGAGKMNFLGNIFSVRAYSRALSATEIAANYAVDKARFNLPTT